MKRLFLLPIAMMMGLVLQASQVELSQRAVAQAKPDVKPVEKPKFDATKKGRGYKPLTPARRAHFQALDRVKHGDRIQRAAKNLNLPAAFDVRVRSPLPIWDQGSCGSCYEVSTVRTMTDAGVEVGLGKPDGSFMLSAQYGMDSPRDFGGCGGGNGTEVVAWAVSNGWIAEKWVDTAGVTHNDYPAYEAQSGRDRTAPGARKWVSGWTWGMVNNSGKPSIADIKAAMFLHGRLNVSLDAGGDFGSGTGTITRLGNNIDHEINMVAWDDAKDGGSLLLENQWGEGWGNNGVRWVTYTAGEAIVDHFWVSAGVIPPPPPPPGPIPPVPGAPVITSPLTATGAVGGSFSYQIVAAGATEFAAAGLPDNLTCAAGTGLISGTPSFGGTFNVTLSAGNKTATTTAALVLAVSNPGPPPVPPGPTVTFAQDVKAGTYKLVAVDAVVGPSNAIIILPTDSWDTIVGRVQAAKAGRQTSVEPPVAPKQVDFAKKLAALEDGQIEIMKWIKIQRTEQSPK